MSNTKSTRNLTKDEVDEMIIKKVETKVYTEHAYCECGGEFTSTNSAYASGTGPTLYYHICDKCDKDIFLDDVYPRLVYEEARTNENNIS